jgi:hypothetical protein
MDTSCNLSLPTLGDSNFESWKQSLHVVASAINAEMHLVKEVDPATLKGDDKKQFFTLANIMLSSFSERARAIAIGPGTPLDIVPFLCT